MNQIKKVHYLLCAIFLSSCGSDDSNFRAVCNGKKITYANQVLQVGKEPRQYKFTANSLGGSNCSFVKGIIFCYKESLDQGVRKKDQLTFDRGYYTMTDIKTVISASKSGDPAFVNTEIYQANCPITILPADKK